MSEKDDFEKHFETEFAKYYQLHLVETICNRIINDYQYEEEDYFTVWNKKMHLLRLENRDNAVFSQVNILKNNEGETKDWEHFDWDSKLKKFQPLCLVH